METIQLKLFCGEIGESGEVEERIRLSLICKKNRAPIQFTETAPLSRGSREGLPLPGVLSSYSDPFFLKSKGPFREGKGPEPFHGSLKESLLP